MAKRNYKGLNATLIHQLKKKIHELDYRLEFEKIIADILSKFIFSKDIDSAINFAIAEIGKLTLASRVYIFLFNEDRTKTDNTHEWCAEGVSPQIDSLKNLPTSMVPWWMKKLNNGETIHIEDVSKLPKEAKAEKKILERQNIKSLLVLPLCIQKELAGFVGFDNVMNTEKWSNDNLSLLSMFSEILGNVFEKKKAECELRTEKEFSETILSTMPEGMNIVDEKGTIKFMNKAFLEVFGKNAIGKKCWEVYRDDKTQCYNCPLKKSIKLGKISLIESSGIANGKTFLITHKGMNLKEGSKALLGIFRDITEQKKAEDKIKERIKELSLIYNFIKLVKKSGIALEKIYSRVLDFIPSAFHYPKLACARISIEGVDYKTRNFKKTRWNLSEKVGKFGIIEVYYSKKKAFLKEERNLLAVVAEGLKQIIERIKTEEKFKSELNKSKQEIIRLKQKLKKT